MRTARTLGLAVVLAAGLLPAVAAPAVGGSIPSDQDSGSVGRHTTLDSDEYPTADCRYSAGTLASIRVRPPVVYARSRTSGEDSQLLAWRARLYKDGNFALTVGNTTLQVATGTDRRAAPFTPRTFDMSGFASGLYYVATQVFWYAPGDEPPDSPAGEALHFTRHYAVNTTQRMSMIACPTSSPSVTFPPGTPLGHVSSYGVHALYDDRHNAAARCVYSGSTDLLVKVTATGPIVFARDKGSGIQSQDVRWRFRVQSTVETDTPDKTTLWDPLHTSSWVRFTTSERRARKVADRSRTLQADQTGFPFYRVIVDIRWLRSDGTVEGRVSEVAPGYLLVAGDVPIGKSIHCPGDGD